jgi:ABC-2 type transport system ATP-binding protein
MIEVEGLTMYYGATLAVDKASFKVDKGTILGLLGPNGAGKTTIINILTTQLIPTKGTARVGGFDILNDPLKVRERIGYLPETVPLYLEMEVEEYLRFVAAGRRLDSITTGSRLKWVVDACGLRKVLYKQIIELSKGYRQRVGLAQALIHDPEILILDEPTSGLDPLQIIGIRDLLKDLSRSKTIVISTHILQEVSAISDRIVIINEGKIIANGTMEDLEKKATDHTAYSIILQGDGEAIERALKNVGRVRLVKRLEPWGYDGCFGFEIQGEGSTPLWPELARIIKEQGWLVREFAEKKPTLEETFIALTQSSRRSIW